MNLKESYRYANYLDKLLSDAYKYLSDRGFVTTTRENHLRSKTNKDALDEIVEVQKTYDVDFTTNDVITFVVKVLREKDRLADAIAIAKDSAGINIDNAIASNKKKQGFTYVLNRMADIKSGETTNTARAYKFDINGEQKPYVYDVVKTTTIDFNRNDVKALIKKYNKECDEVSAKLDEVVINTIVDFDPMFDISDTFEDIMETLSK